MDIEPQTVLAVAAVGALAYTCLNKKEKLKPVIPIVGGGKKSRRKSKSKRKSRRKSKRKSNKGKSKSRKSKKRKSKSRKSRKKSRKSKCSIKCWKGYKRVPGKGCGKGSCVKKSLPKRKSKKIVRKSKPKKSLGSGGSIQDAIRKYERACNLAENSRIANPGFKNNDCNSVRYHVSKGRMTKSKIETYTRMHLLALKLGNDAYHIKQTDINAAYKAEFGTLKI